MAMARRGRPERPSWYKDDEVQISLSVPPGEEHRFNSDGSSKIHRPEVKKSAKKVKLKVPKIGVQKKKKQEKKKTIFDIIDLD